MGDDQKATLLLFLVSADALRDDPYGVDVETGIRLIQDGQRRSQHMKLKDLCLFLLTARETHVEIALRIGPFNVKRIHRGVQLLAELEQERTLARALLDRASNERRNGKPRHLHRILKGHEESCPGALVRGFVLYVLTIEYDLSLRDLIAGISHQGKTQRRLAGSIGAHQYVRLSAADGKVHAL